MATEISRRSFLRGSQDQTLKACMRPPGAVGTSFADLCKTCDACQSACPEDVISMDSEGRPVLDFSQAHCTFCGLCAEACPSGALRQTDDPQTAWRAQIDGTCWSLNGVSCRMCQDTCPQSAIRFQLQVGGRAAPSIDLASCTGCGACSTVCPADAVAFFQPTEQPTEQPKEHVA